MSPQTAPETVPETATVYRLAELPQDRPMAGIGRRRIIGERVMVSEIEIDKGCKVPPHAHANEQLVVLLQGRLQFDVGTSDGGSRRVLLEAGDVLLLPAHVRHGGEAIEDCRVLDIFSPPSATTGIDRG